MQNIILCSSAKSEFFYKIDLKYRSSLLQIWYFESRALHTCNSRLLINMRLKWRGVSLLHDCVFP